jgi:two-component system chemotaxis sensor kinase CheA
MSQHDLEMWASFASEGADVLRGVEESLLQLEAEPGNADEINRLYRGLHTLKGNAGFLALSSFERVAHACEDLISLVRDKGLALDDEITEVLLAAIDKLRAGLDAVSREHRDLEPDSVDGVVSRAKELYLERGGEVRQQLTVEFEIFDDEPAVSEMPAVLAPPVVPVAPPAHAAQEHHALVLPAVVLSPDLAAAAAQLKSAPTTAPKPAPVPVKPPQASPPKAPPKPAPGLAPSSPSLSRVLAQTTEAPTSNTMMVSALHRAIDQERADVLRINAAKVATLMELAGELGLACSAVTRHPGVLGRDLEGFAAASHKLELLVRDLQNDLSSLRLVPVSAVFQRMRRVVRDASRRTGKRVELLLQGEDTEVDKVMLDALQDPLVHVLRNAVDHGIESEEDRATAGKAPIGRIVLSASYQGGEVTVEVRDDGRGLDRTRILARAKERGLCSQDAQPSDDEIAQFIFLPGFSTKEKADELSGRGVGMDVLKTTVESLRGHVQVKSNPGRGSRITMTIPLTLAFVEVMIVRERDRLFALPIEKVFEVSKVEASMLAPNSADGFTMLRVRGQCVPVFWLHRFWGEARSNESILGRVAVVVQTARGVLALPVDELLGNQQVMVKPLRGVLAGVRAAVGCGMLRTGDIAVALDCEQFHA